MRFVSAVVSVFVLAVVAGSNLAAQGFNWQYSARYPFVTPTRFYGLEIGSGYAMHTGELHYIEAQTAFDCCVYNTGSGTPVRFGVGVDEWITPTVSLQLTAGIAVRGASFLSDISSLARRDEPAVETQFSFDGSLTYAALQGVLRYRIPSTHLNIGGGTRVLVKVGSTSTQSILVRRMQSGTMQQTETVLTTSPISDARTLLIEALATLSYDISISRGLYCSPTLQVALPLLSTSSQQSWYTTDVNFALRFMKSI